VGKGLYEGELVMETIVYGVCIAICGFVMGHVVGYGKGHDDMEKIYKDIYSNKENL
jgi:hypothetical protein